ncbi:MAG: N-acetyl-gamma-glutamyl-phosphate reductase [Acidobacteriota bacterium]|nr:N-acetyl-gamma-glutamyl-phosphate reductase [Acidobacteriota bacterium]
MKVKIGVVGVGGYAGLELIRLVGRHPGVDFASAMDVAGFVGKPLGEVHTSLRGVCDLVVAPPDPEKAAGLDTVFLCTPDKVSHELAPQFLRAGARVIDFSGAFRLKDAANFAAWYGFDHADKGLLSSAVYGLAEWNAREIAPAKLIANPGCYPTSVELALLPLVRAGMLETGSEIFCDSKSGVSGAGRAPKADMMFVEVVESFRPYSPVRHRHAPEMCQALGWDIENFTFVPHLLPIRQGILSTIYVSFNRQVGAEELEAEYARRYSGRRFVRILGSSRLPEIGAVAGTNFCDIAWRLTHNGKRAVVFSAIDNLIKGAAGQALQNFNIMHGLDEAEGIL